MIPEQLQFQECEQDTGVNYEAWFKESHAF